MKLGRKMADTYTISSGDETVGNSFSFQGATYDNLNDEGYLVVDALSPEEAEEIADDLVNYTYDVLFDHRGFEVPRDHPLSLNVLTDKRTREELLGDTKSESVWEGGMSRKPIISKSCGMWHGHYSLNKLRKIDFNPKLYEISASVIGTDKLAFRAGIERFSIKCGVTVDSDSKRKAEGATDMPKHIDTCLFDDTPNYDFRIQSLVCLSVGNDVAPRDSGTLNLLVNFHHYWTFARHVLHPRYGLVTMPNCSSRFHVLPDDWDTKYLLYLNGHAEAYTIFLHDRKRFMQEFKIERQVFEFYKWLEEIGVRVPETFKLIHWKPIVMKPGQMVFWHQYLPHQSLRNKSATPRIVAYYNLHAIHGPEWYHSEEYRWLLDMATQAHFYYGIDCGKYPRDVKNTEELNYLRDTGLLQDVVDLITTDPLARKLIGLDVYQF